MTSQKNRYKTKQASISKNFHKKNRLVKNNLNLKTLLGSRDQKDQSMKDWLEEASQETPSDGSLPFTSLSVVKQFANYESSFWENVPLGQASIQSLETKLDLTHSGTQIFSVKRIYEVVQKKDFGGFKHELSPVLLQDYFDERDSRVHKSWQPFIGSENNWVKKINEQLNFSTSYYFPMPVIENENLIGMKYLLWDQDELNQEVLNYLEQLPSAIIDKVQMLF